MSGPISYLPRDWWAQNDEGAPSSLNGVGDVFSGRYELVDPLGEGGGGLVWRVWDRGSRQYLAAKVLRQVDAGSLMRFMREQSVRIEHEHVMTPMSWAGEDDRVLFTMPLVRGGSVATLVGDFGGLPGPWVATLLDQVLVALEQIHSEGLVHRDVKPANLLLDVTGLGLPRLRLSDFGVATVLDQPRLTHGALTVGTRGYVAPECLAGEWDPDPRADLYSLGITAAEMATGLRLPLAGSATPFDAGALLRTRGVHPDLVAWVEQLTATDPADRPQTATSARLFLRATGLVATESDDLGSDIEVFDQVPPLPTGWSDRGPQLTGSESLIRSGPETSTPSDDPEPRGRARNDHRASYFALVVFGALLLGLALTLMLGAR